MAPPVARPSVVKTQAPQQRPSVTQANLPPPPMEKGAKQPKLAPAAKAGDFQQVSALVESVKQYKGFKQMAQYNISCLISHITPPNVGWMENIRYAVESGAIFSIIDVLRTHPAALEVVRTAIEALRKLAIDAQNAEVMAKAGAVEAALNAMLKSGDDAVAEEGGELIAQISMHAPEALLNTPGTVQALIGALHTGGNLKVMASVLNTLDRVARTDNGESEIRRLQGIPAILAVMGPGRDTTEEMLRPAFRLLERFARDNTAVTEIRKAGGVEALVRQMELHSKNDGLLRAAGRLLARVAEDDLEGTIKRLGEANLPTEVRHFLTALISNLAMRPDMIDKIIKNGGIKAILSGFAEFNDSTKEAAARAIGRLANNPENIAMLFRDGAVEAMTGAVNNAGSNEALLAVAAGALANMAVSKEFCKVIDEKGGAQAVLKKLKEHPDLEVFAAEALRLFQNMATHGHDMSALINSGLIKAVVEAMKRNPMSPEVQMHGFATLEHLLRDAAGGGKTGAKVAAELIGVGGVPVMAVSLSTQAANGDVVAAGLKTHLELIERDPKASAKALAAADSTAHVVRAVYTQTMQGNRGIDDVAKAIIARMVSPKDAEGLVAAIKKNTAAAIALKNDESTDKLEAALQAAAVFAKVKPLHEAMFKAGMAPTILGAWLDFLNEEKSIPHSGDVLETFANAVTELGKSDKKNLDALVQAKLIDAVQKPLRALTQEKPMAATLRTLRMVAAPLDYKRAIIEDGCVESTVAALRTMPNSAMVFEPALETMLHMCATDESAAAVANKGGTRQILKGLQENCANAAFERTAEVGLLVLEKVAKCSQEQYKTIAPLVKSGAVPVVIASMEAFPRNENIEATGARVLALLLDPEGVSEAIDKMRDITDRLIKTKDEGLLPELSRATATVGYLAMAPQNKQMMREKAAGKCVMDMIRFFESLRNNTGDNIIRGQARRAAFRALGQMAVAGVLDKSLGAVKYVVDAVKDPAYTPHEKQAVLDCIKSMAANADLVAELLAFGAVEAILDVIRRFPHNEALVTAALGALAALGEHEAGAKALTEAGARDVVMRWFNDNKDTAGPRGVEAAMIALSNLALVDSNVPLMLKEGLVDMVMAAMDFHCSDPNNPQPRVLNAAVGLLGRVATSEAAIKELIKKGAVQRAIQIARSSPVYLGDAAAMEALIFLIESCGLVDEARRELVRAGAVEMIMAAMNINSGNEEVVVTGARALQTLMGSSADTIKQVLKEVSELAARLKKTPNDRDIQDALDRALQNLANLALVAGLVDSHSASEIAHVLADLMGILQTLPEGPARTRLLVRAAQALGHLPLIDGVDFDESEAIAKLLQMIRANPDDDAVLEAALIALANLLNGPKALATLSSLKGFDDIARILAMAGDDPKLKEAATRVLERARETAQANPNLVEAAVLAALLKAAAGDQAQLRAFLQKMAMNGGAPALVRAFGMDLSGLDIGADLLRALREGAANMGMELMFADLDALKALLAALNGGNKEKQKEALRLLPHLGKDALLQLARLGGIAALLKLMMENLDDPDMVLGALNALNRMIMFDGDFCLPLLFEEGGVEKLRQVLEAHKDNPNIVREALKLLTALAKKYGVDRIGANEELLRTLQGIFDKYGMDMSGLEDLLKDLRNLFNDEGPEMIGVKLDRALFGGDLADNIEEHVADDGRVYYVDTKTKQSTWQKPAAYAAVISAMEGLAKLTEAHKEAISAVNPKALTAAVGQIEAHPTDPQRLTALAKALATLASNSENRAAIAKAGGLQAIIKALQGDVVDVEFIEAAINLMNQFSRNEAFREQIAKLGGIKALIQIMLKFIDNKAVVEKCLTTLANLGYNSDANVKEIIVHGGIEATLKVMQKWAKETSVLQLSLILLINCMYGSDDNKLKVGQVCGQEVVQVVARHHKDVKTFNAANKALGNLSYLDANIRLMIDAHATKYMVQGMDAHTHDVMAQQVAIDVIANFASLSEEVHAQKIARGEMQSVCDIIILEGGAARILKTVKETDEIQLLMSGMDALANLANDPKATEKMLKLGIVQMVVDAMAQYDWDEQLMARTVRLLAHLTYSSEGVKEIVARDGIQVLLSGMETHVEEPEFLKSAVIALKNIAQEADFRSEIEKLGGIEAVLNALERHMDHRDLAMEILQLFVRMTMNKAASEAIATRGMHLILQNINGRSKDAEFLTRSFILLGHLAFHEPNLKVIAQYGGVGLIIESICNHPESRELLLRSVQTLDNIAMANQEHAKIVTNEGGADAIRAVQEAYADDPEVCQVCKSALISMTTLETRAAKPRRQFLGGQDEEIKEGEDPLKDHRNLLKAGSIMIEWSASGGPASRHVYIQSDSTGMNALVWRDPKKGTSRSSTMLLRDIRLVRGGASDGHVKQRKKAKPECSFSIVGRATTIDLEATSPDEAKQWIAAMGALLYCVRKDQSWLR